MAASTVSKPKQKTATASTSSTKATVTKTGNSITGRFTLKNLPTFDAAETRKPLLAVVGVADLAIEQVKDVPALYVAEAKRVQARFAEFPAQVKAFPGQVEKANKKATDLYSQLSVRGERLVTSIRRQPATEAAIVEGKEAVRKAEASANAARRSVKAGEKAVEQAVEKLG